MYGGHKSLIFAHLFQGLADVLEKEQLRVVGAELEELPQIAMLCVLGSDTLLLQNAEEIVRFEEGHGEQARLGLHFLLEEDVGEELLRRHVLLQQVHHEHDHDLHRLLVKFGQVECLASLLGRCTRVLWQG